MNFNYFFVVLGFVIFCALPAIFVLITAKGCVKTIKVATRFFLDSTAARLAENDQIAKSQADFYSRLGEVARLFRKIEIAVLCLFASLFILSVVFAILGKVNPQNWFSLEILGGFLFCILCVALNISLTYICKEK